MHLTFVNPAYCGAKLFPTSCRENLTQKLFRVMISKLRDHRTSKQLLLAMKITAIFLFVASLHLSAKTLGQQVTLSVKEASLKTVFLELNRQTGFNFLYSDEALSKAAPVTLKVQNESLEKVLVLCFKGQPLSYTIENNSIVVNPKATAVVISNQRDKLYPPPIDVHGRIVNEMGDPVAGASVQVKGNKSLGTITDENGRFELKGVESNAILIINGINIDSFEFKVNGITQLLLTAKIKVKDLDAVIVNKGYYSTSKKLNTGSVVKVSGEQITNQPITNPILGLSGLVPGLLITQNTGLPGSRFTALIRGQNSIQNGNSPLYIIDGVPFLSDRDALTQLNGMLANSPFNSLDPNNIESIEVLKDADATAIYGSRGANGVILITTKKINTEKNSLSLNITRGWGKVTRTMELMNTQEYLEMRKEAFANDGVTPTLANAPDLLAWDQNRYTDWKNFFIGGTAQTYDAQLRYSGGSDFTKFSIGSGYHKETTVFPVEAGDKKSNVDISINHKSNNSKLNLIITSSYGLDKILLPSQNINRVMSLAPNSYPLIDSVGAYVWREGGYSGGNLLASMQQTSYNATERLTANGIISYKFNKSLEFKTNVGFNRTSLVEKSVSPIISQDPANNPKGSTVFGNNYIKTMLLEQQLNYNTKIFNKLKIETLFGLTLQKSLSERNLIQGNGYTNDALLQSILAAPFITSSDGKFQYNYAAIFGRIGMDWSNKYLLNITGRRDGSSRFGPDNRFANFGAIGAGWVFSKEQFVKNNFTFLSFAKLRGSYGLTGNDQIGNYQFLDTYKGTVYAYQGQPGLKPTRLFNADYSWEENKKTEVALELGFLKDKIILNLSYYQNKSDNQIIRYSLPAQTGFNDVLMNFPGQVVNKGFEISISADIIKRKNFQWHSSFNISANKNILLAFPDLESSSYASSYLIGKPLNSYQGLHFTGVDPQTGIYQFDDTNNDGQINDNDFSYFGTTDPKFYGGFSNLFSYKNLQLSILLEFRKQLGRDIVYSFARLIGDLQNQSVLAANRWQSMGDLTPYQKYSQTTTGAAFKAGGNLRQSDAILTDASYLRVRNVVLSYKLPDSWLRKLNMLSWKAYCQVQNLFTITKYKGHDPENQSPSVLPPLKMFTAGIQINF